MDSSAREGLLPLRGLVASSVIIILYCDCQVSRLIHLILSNYHFPLDFEQIAPTGLLPSPFTEAPNYNRNIPFSRFSRRSEILKEECIFPPPSLGLMVFWRRAEAAEGSTRKLAGSRSCRPSRTLMTAVTVV